MKTEKATFTVRSENGKISLEIKQNRFGIHGLRVDLVTLPFKTHENAVAAAKMMGLLMKAAD